MAYQSVNTAINTENNKQYWSIYDILLFLLLVEVHFLICTQYSIQHTQHSTQYSTQHTIHSTQFSKQHNTQHTIHQTTQYSIQYSAQHNTAYNTAHSTQYTAHTIQYIIGQCDTFYIGMYTNQCLCVLYNNNTV